MLVPGVGAGFSPKGGPRVWASEAEGAPAAPRRRGKAGGMRGSRLDPASREDGRSRARPGGGPWAARAPPPWSSMDHHTAGNGRR